MLRKNNQNLLKGAFIGICALAVALFWVFTHQQQYPPISACSDCNIVFIEFDTLRAANIHTLRYPRETTPNLDKLAERSYTFTNAISVSSWTLPASMSIFTGVYPSQHKVLNKITILPSNEQFDTTLQKVAPNLQTLAQVLKRNGWQTGGFTGGAALDRVFGFNQGFDAYTDGSDTFPPITQNVPKALAWAAEHKNEKFFLFLQGYDTHGQNVPPGGYDRRFVDFSYTGKLTGSAEEQKALREDRLARGHIDLTQDDARFLTDLYDEKVQRADAELKTFLEAYRALGVKNKTIFIITSGHGEELYEHNQIDHGHSLYDELIHVPLFVVLPDMNKGVQIKEQARNIDLMPTILDLVGLSKTDDVWKQFQGESLLPMLLGKNQPLNIFPETDYRYAVSLRSVRTADGWELIKDIQSNQFELYHVSVDKNEKNKITNNPEMLDSLSKKLESHFQQFTPQTPHIDTKILTK
jgi:arylsulfatase